MARQRDSDPSREKFHLLLFQLGETLKDPPIVIDFYDWRENVEFIIEEIQKLSHNSYERLSDLIGQAILLGEAHVKDIDRDASPRECEQSRVAYFEQIAFVNSEINSLLTRHPNR